MKTTLITNIKDMPKENLSPFTLKIIEVLENGGRILGVTRNGTLIGITTHYVK